MNTQHTWTTDELPVSTKLKNKRYEILSSTRSTKNSYNYTAKTKDGTVVQIKEFYLRDICKRKGFLIDVSNKEDSKTWSSLVKGFIQNAAFLTSLDSVHVPNVREVFEENGTAYMASDLAEGETLSDMLDDWKPNKFKPEDVMKISNGITSALLEIHGFGMLHRDVTPSNIMIKPDGETLLLPDFATFREDRSKASQIVSSVLKSNQEYTPFELAFDEYRQGDGSDLYSMAGVLYHLITGKPPVSSLDRVAARAAGDEDPFEPLPEKIEGYEDRFLLVINMAMELFLEDRISSATEFMMITSDSTDYTKAIRMKSDVGKRSAGLKKVGLFGRVKNLLFRSS